MEQSKKSSGFENYFSEYGSVVFDGYCGEPVSWDFKIMTYIGEE